MGQQCGAGVPGATGRGQSAIATLGKGNEESQTSNFHWRITDVPAMRLAPVTPPTCPAERIAACTMPARDATGSLGGTRDDTD